MKDIDDATLDNIEDSIIGGADIQTSVLVNGFNVRKFFRLLEEGMIAYNKEAEGGKVLAREKESYQIYKRVARARALAAQRHLERIRQSEDWKAHKWLLESQHPETHGGMSTIAPPIAFPQIGGGFS